MIAEIGRFIRYSLQLSYQPRKPGEAVFPDVRRSVLHVS